jgi:hypothetical protein
MSNGKMDALNIEGLLKGPQEDRDRFVLTALFELYRNCPQCMQRNRTVRGAITGFAKYMVAPVLVGVIVALFV